MAVAVCVLLAGLVSAAVAQCGPLSVWPLPQQIAVGSVPVALSSGFAFSAGTPDPILSAAFARYTAIIGAGNAGPLAAGTASLAGLSVEFVSGSAAVPLQVCVHAPQYPQWGGWQVGVVACVLCCKDWNDAWFACGCVCARARVSLHSSGSTSRTSCRCHPPLTPRWRPSWLIRCGVPCVVWRRSRSCCRVPAAPQWFRALQCPFLISRGSRCVHVCTHVWALTMVNEVDMWQWVGGWRGFGCTCATAEGRGGGA
jgi:hypothetical protein